MPIKYECPKCGRRFADWGAEKLGFKCPMDDSCPTDQQKPESAEEVELVRLGSQDDQLTPRRATTKRTQRRAVDVKPLENQGPEVDPEIDDVDGVFETDDIESDADIEQDDDSGAVFDSDDAVADGDDESDDDAAPIVDEETPGDAEEGRF